MKNAKIQNSHLQNFIYVEQNKMESFNKDYVPPAVRTRTPTPTRVPTEQTEYIEKAQTPTPTPPREVSELPPE